MKYTLPTFVLLIPAAPLLAAGSESGGSVFAGSLAQSIAAIVIFVLLLALLMKVAWGPILKGLQEREGKIKSDLEKAEKAAHDAAATLAEYKANLAAAHEEARRIIEQSKADAEKVAAQVKEQTQQEITGMKTRAEADIRHAREQALAEIYSQAATLSTTVAGRILRREINPADQQQLVDDAVREMAQSSRN